MTLTVAQAFRVAFEFWEVSKEGTDLNKAPKQNKVIYNCPNDGHRNKIICPFLFVNKKSK